MKKKKDQWRGVGGYDGSSLLSEEYRTVVKQSEVHEYTGPEKNIY